MQHVGSLNDTVHQTIHRRAEQQYNLFLTSRTSIRELEIGEHLIRGNYAQDQLSHMPSLLSYADQTRCSAQPDLLTWPAQHVSPEVRYGHIITNIYYVQGKLSINDLIDN